MLERINTIITLELKIRQALSKAEKESILANITHDKSNSLNAEFYLGKYAAYMEILKSLDKEKYLHFVAYATELCNSISNGLNASCF